MSAFWIMPWHGVVLLFMTIMVYGSDPVDDIDDLTKAYGSLDSMMNDVFDALEAFTEGIGAIDDKAGKISSLFVKAAKVVIDPDTKEGIALSKFQRYFGRKMKMIIASDERREASQLYNEIVVQYNLFVKTHMLHIRRVFHELSYGNGTVTEAELNQTCVESYLGSPRKLLDYISTIYVTNCPLNGQTMPLEEESKWMASALELFQKSERHLEIEFQQKSVYAEYIQLKRTYMNDLISVSTQTASENFKILSQELTSFCGQLSLEKVNVLLRTAIRKLPKNNFPCFTNIAITNFDFEFDPVYKLITMSLLDVRDLGLTASMCAEVITHGDSTRRQAKIDESTRTIVKLAEHLEAYLPKKLETFWPDMTMSVAKNVIGIDDITSHYKYGGLAKTIRNELNKRGNEKMLYQTLVFPAWTTSEKYFTRCEANSCIKIIDYHNINVFIAKYPIGSIDRAVDAQNWVKENGPTIKNLIEQNYDIGSITDLIPIIEAKVGKLTSANKFHSFAYLRNWAWSPSSATVHYGLGNNTIDGIHTMAMIEYSYDPWGKSAEDHKLFMFL